MHDMGDLHARNCGAEEWKHQYVAACRHKSAAEHDDPIDRLLAGIEQVRRRMLLAKAAALHHPLDIEAIWNVPGNPHQEDRYNAKCEGEAEEIVRVFARTRQCRKCIRPYQG